MFHHAILIHKLALRLKNHLIGFRLIDCYSQNKDELILILQSQNDTFCIKADLRPQVSLLSFPDQISRARKNSVALMDQIIDTSVVDIIIHPLDRSFTILFEDNYQLIFKLYGRRSNLLLFQKEHLIHLFRSELKQDRELIPETFLENSNKLNKPIDKDLETVFTRPITEYLSKIGLTYSAKLSIDHLLSLPTYVSTSGKPKISLIDRELEELSSYSDIIFAINAYQKAYINEVFFVQEKLKTLQSLNKKKSQSENYIAKSNSKLIELKERRSFREVADIIMANLHQIPKDTEQIVLFDFYKNENITINIKKNTSPQAFAETLYKKSKNELLEIQSLKQNISDKKALLDQINQQIESLTQSKDWKTLRHFEQKSTEKNQESKALPYFSFEKNGYEIRVGKDAKRNDQLTTQFSSKDDIWLHAKDVPGSHVIIRNPERKKVPMAIIEYAAGLAAYYSKRKSDTLCPVLYTSRKYVRKSKKLAPGKVIVEREEVVLIEPLNPHR